MTISESPNDAMYRRLEGLHRGPPILMSLADGEIWTTRELASCRAQNLKRVYNLLERYTRRGLVRRIPMIQETFQLPTIKRKARVRQWQITEDGLARVRGGFR